MTGFLATIWRDLAEDPDVLAAVLSDGTELLPLLPSPLPVGRLAHDAVAAATLQATLAAGAGPERFSLDPHRVAAAYMSERHFRVDGEAPYAWAALSGFWPAADGWVRTHANYPHHRARLLAALALPDGADRDGLARALASIPALEAERRIVAAGGIAAAVRTPEEWTASAAGAAAEAGPLLTLTPLGEAPPEAALRGDATRPLAGIRVLDLTRVIAGPVATRTLALLGADVLRIDPPELPEPVNQWLDTGMGKRSTLLDLRAPGDRAAFDRLLASADVLVSGYRPRALDALGLSPHALAGRRPGIVVARLSAWGPGPWADRRGFDSIVQAASGIAALTGAPGVLPAQALDHSAGYLLAAAVTALLRRRATEGGSWLAETSLARIAAELVGADRVSADPGVLRPAMLERNSPSGRLSYPAPALASPPAPADWEAVGRVWGAAAPEWLS